MNANLRKTNGASRASSQPGRRKRRWRGALSVLLAMAIAATTLVAAPASAQSKDKEAPTTPAPTKDRAVRAAPGSDDFEFVSGGAIGMTPAIDRIVPTSSSTVTVQLAHSIGAEVLVKIRDSNGAMLWTGHTNAWDGNVVITDADPRYTIEPSTRYCIQILYHGSLTPQACGRSANDDSPAGAHPSSAPAMFEIIRPSSNAVWQVEMNPEYVVWARIEYGEEPLIDGLFDSGETPFFGDFDHLISGAIGACAPSAGADESNYDTDIFGECVESTVNAALDQIANFLEREAVFNPCIDALIAGTFGNAASNALEGQIADLLQGPIEALKFLLEELLKSCLKTHLMDLVDAEASHEIDYTFYERSEWASDMIFSAVIGALLRGNLIGALINLVNFLLFENRPDNVPTIEHFWWNWTLHADVDREGWTFSEHTGLDYLRTAILLCQSSGCDGQSTSNTGIRPVLMTGRTRGADTINAVTLRNVGIWQQLVRDTFATLDNESIHQVNNRLSMVDYSPQARQLFKQQIGSPANVILADHGNRLNESTRLMSWAIDGLGAPTDPQCGFFDTLHDAAHPVHCGSPITAEPTDALVLPVLRPGYGAFYEGDLTVAHPRASQLLLKRADGTTACTRNTGSEGQTTWALSVVYHQCPDATQAWLVAKDGVDDFGLAMTIRRDRGANLSVTNMTSLGLEGRARTQVDTGDTVEALLFPGVWNYRNVVTTPRSSRTYTGVSEIHLSNVSWRQASYQLTSYDADGDVYTTKNITIPARGSRTVTMAQLQVPSAHGIEASVRITCNGCDHAAMQSTGLVAAAVTESRTNGAMMRWSGYTGTAESTSASTARMPNYYYLNPDGNPAPELFSAGVVMPIDADSTVSASLQQRPDCGACSGHWITMPTYSNHAVNTFAGYNSRTLGASRPGFRTWSATFNSSVGRLVGMGKELSPGTMAHFRLLTATNATKFLLAPGMRRVWSDNGQRFGSAAIAQNLGNSAATVVLTFHNQSGEDLRSFSKTIQPGQSFGINIDGPPGEGTCGDLNGGQCANLKALLGQNWSGFVTATSSQPIAGIVKTIETAGTGTDRKRIRSITNATALGQQW